MQCLNKLITHLSTAFKNHGTIQEQSPINSNLRFVQISDILVIYSPSDLPSMEKSLPKLWKCKSFRESLPQIKKSDKTKALTVNKIDDASSEAETVGKSATLEEQLNQKISCDNSITSVTQIVTPTTAKLMTTL